MKSEIISLVVEGEDSSGLDKCAWAWEGRKVGNDPRNAVTQRGLLDDVSKSLDAEEAI